MTSWTPQLASLFGDRTFDTEESLHQFMDEKGIGDFRIVLLDGKPHLVKPTDQHNMIISKLVARFTENRGMFRAHTMCIFRRTLVVNQMYASSAALVASATKMGSWNPTMAALSLDVVIQLSWKKKRGYDKGTMDDMMNLSLERREALRLRTAPELAIGSRSAS